MNVRQYKIECVKLLEAVNCKVPGNAFKLEICEEKA